MARPTATWALAHGLQGLRGAPLAVPTREPLRPDRDVLATRYELFRRAA